MKHCEECGLPMSRCICEDVACYKCQTIGCDGECDELDLSEVEELDFNHGEDSAA